jgi:hypothetical protein
MGGFFRRFRRSKDAEEPTDAEEAPPEESSEEPTGEGTDDSGEVASDAPLPDGADAATSDTSLMVDPEAPLPDTPDAPRSEPQSDAPTSVDFAPVAADDVDSASAPGPAGPTDPMPGPETPSAGAPLAESAPPPLPEADPAAALTSMSRQRPGTLCFLCGSEMDGSYCPSCKMHWTE